MITLSTNCKLVECAADLAAIPQFHTVYLDFETSSGDAAKSSANPWHNCKPIGYAITGDNHPCAYFVPWSLPDNAAQDCFEFTLAWCKQWVNHNIKYDYHVAANAGAAIPDIELVCTIMESCLVDSDRRYKPGGRELEALARAWLPAEFRKRKDLLARYLKNNNKDFGRIPLDILGEYACGDVHVTRALHLHCLRIIEQQNIAELYANEKAFTRVLIDMERTGLYIDKLKVMQAEFVARNQMAQIEKQLHEQLGYYINPNSNKQIFDLICNRYGMPVLKWTDPKKNKSGKAGPSFDKEAMLMYDEHPDTPEALQPILKLLTDYKGLSLQCSLFYEKWQQLAIDSESGKAVLHAEFNQNVATGRLSCSNPNDQQLNTEAKELIEPPPGYVLLSFDQSQIEYRVLVNYMQSQKAIEAYNNDPNTDFHVWVAITCDNIERKPAKTINFMVSFGGGEDLTIRKLANDFRKLGRGYSTEEAKQRAINAFNAWHREFPENRIVRKAAENKCKQRGYVRNLAGRRLQIPGPRHNIWRDDKGRIISKCHNALPLATQSTAADIAKFLSVRIQPLLRTLGVKLAALVHDEFVFFVPDKGEQFILHCAAQIKAALEVSPFKMSVPLRCDGGYSAENWAAAGVETCGILARKRDEGKFSENFQEFLRKALAA